MRAMLASNSASNRTRFLEAFQSSALCPAAWLKAALLLYMNYATKTCTPDGHEAVREQSCWSARSSAEVKLEARSLKVVSRRA